MFKIFFTFYIIFLQIIISLAQEHRRSQKDRKIRLLQIGFCLYQVSQMMDATKEEKIKRKMPKLNDQFFAYNYDVGTSGPYINYREVFARFELSPGSYVIVPATFESNCPGKFMIRVYNSCSQCHITEL